MKSKQKKTKKEVEQEQQPQPSPTPCQVCYFADFQGEIFEKLTCVLCGIITHKNCYSPDFKEKEKIKFKCDPCKKRNSKNKDKQFLRYNCSHCGSQDGLMRQIGNNTNIWMHVLCALSAPKIQLISYQYLQFQVQGEQKKHIANRRCAQCGSDRSAGSPCQIENCQKYIHLNCISKQYSKNQDYGATLSVGLLDKNEGSLLYRLKKQMDKHFPALQIMNANTSEPKLIVCPEHNGDGSFIWCTCNSVKGPQQTQQTECEKCKRWYHNECLGAPKVVICKGCNQNNIYTKRLQMPQLIKKAAEIESSQQLDKQSIKFLDHFSLKLSSIIEKNIINEKNIYEIQRYFLRKDLESQNINQMNEEAQNHIVQVLHYLTIRVYKQETHIIASDIESILAKLSGKNTYDWPAQKTDKPQKKFLHLLQEKLKRLSKDDVRDLKHKLVNFTEKCNHTYKSDVTIVADLYPLLHLIDNSPAWTSVLKKINESDPNLKIFQFLVTLNLPKDQLLQILKGFRKLIHARNCKYIDESDYLDLVQKQHPSLTQQKSKILKHIHMSLLKGTHHRKPFQLRRELLLNIENNYEQVNNKQKINLRNKVIKSGAIFSPNSLAFNFDSEIIQFQICKKLFMKKYNPPDPTDLLSAINTLNQLLTLDLRVAVMTKSERKMYQIYSEKYKFYLNLINYQEQIKKRHTYQQMQLGVLQQACSPQSQQQATTKRIERPRSQQKLQQKLTQVIKEWPYQYESIFYALECFKEIALKQVEFTQNEQDMLTDFFDILMNNIQVMLTQCIFPLRIPLLKQIALIVTHLKLKDNYTFFMQSYQFFTEWKQELQQKFINIDKVLQCPKQSSDLINTLDKKIEELSYHTPTIDLSVQLRKIKIMKMWALFSQKMLVPQRKITIAAMHSIKSLMEKINYPKNAVRTDIQRLDAQSRDLNKKIGRFLQRHKIGDMQFYDQIKFMKNKMTLDEANQLKSQLQRSELDVQIELDELSSQIENASADIDIKTFCKTATNSQTLGILRRQLLEAPFLTYQIELYRHLLQSYYAKKCQQFSGTITKKECFRLLNHGGKSAAILHQKLQPLLKMYKEIEVAEKEVLLSKPSSESLLNCDLKKIKSDLQFDPTECARIQRYYNQAIKLRMKFQAMKQERADMQKFNQLQIQILRIPINNKQIILEITRMRRQIQDISARARVYLSEQPQSQSMSFDSPYTADLLYKYQKIGMKTELLQRLQNIIIKSKQISDLSRNLTFQNYKPFSFLCNSLPQLFKNNQFYMRREEAFTRICQPYIEHSDPLIQVGLALLTEGGYLIRRPTVAQRIHPWIAKVSNKILKLQRNLQNSEEAEEQQIDEDDENSENEDSYDSDEFNQEDLDDGLEELDDESNIDNIELEDQQSMNDDIESVKDNGENGENPQDNNNQRKKKISRKRQRPKTQELVISDDD